MRLAARLGLTAATASAVTVVGLALRQGYQDFKKAAWEVYLQGGCEEWCPCKCHQNGCGCHESKK
jgi:hypothetical protein